jgi:hypothetical protein
MPVYLTRMLLASVVFKIASLITRLKFCWQTTHTSVLLVSSFADDRGGGGPSHGLMLPVAIQARSYIIITRPSSSYHSKQIYRQVRLNEMSTHIQIYQGVSIRPHKDSPAHWQRKNVDLHVQHAHQLDRDECDPFADYADLRALAERQSLR